MTTTAGSPLLSLLPTPVVRAPRLASALGIVGELYVKRDDLTGFAVAGNKARQLDSLLAEAADQRADVLVTGGSPSSNFVQAAAAAAACSGMRCVLVIAGEPVPSWSHPNLAAAAAWGAELRWTGDPDRSSVDGRLPEVGDELTRAGLHPYVAPRGGASVTGALGYHGGVAELMRQLPPGPTPTVVVACGSGGTLAGLVAGSVGLGRPVRLVGASVSRSATEVADHVLSLARGVAERLNEPAAAAADVEVHDVRGPGHGLPSAPGERATALALSCAGLVLDPVYSAKALALLPQVAGDGPAVFWHTGGLLDAVAAWLSRSC